MTLLPAEDIDQRPVHRADVQGLRAVAVLLVIVYHAGLPVPGGFAGVDVFFVISGFVITALLLRELGQTGSIRFRRFYGRRIRRLLPALALVLGIVLVASQLLLSPLGTQQDAAKTGLAAALFAANGELFTAPGGYFAPEADLNPLLHTWSLAVEEQFYVFFPLLLLGAWRLGRRRGRSRLDSGLCLSAVAVLSFAACVVLTYAVVIPYHPKAQPFAFYGSPTRAWEFVAGALIALGAPRLRGMGPRPQVALSVVGVLALVAAAALLDDATPFPGAAALLPVAGTGALIAAGTPSRSTVVSRLLGSRVPTWLGDRSYSLYLWHWPFIAFALALGASDGVVLAAAAASFVPAWASYRFVEQPVRRARRFGGRRVLRLGAACVVVPLVLAAGAFGVATRSTAAVRDIRDQRATHLDERQDCFGKRGDAACAWPKPGGRGEIVLAGDSNAGQFLEGAIPAAPALGRGLTLAALGACPFNRATVEQPTARETEACRAFVDDWVDELVRRQPDLVVIANAGSDYFIPSADTTFVTRAGERLGDADRKEAAWRQGLVPILDRLGDAGVPVVVVHTLPHFIDWDLATCPAVRLYLDAGSCGRMTPAEVIRRQQRRAFRAESRALEGSTGATGVDLSAALCPGGRCSTVDGAFWVMRDGGHITVGEAQRLRGTLRRVFAEGLRLSVN